MTRFFLFTAHLTVPAGHGDPGLGLLLVPVGAALLSVAAFITTARSAGSIDGSSGV